MLPEFAAAVDQLAAGFRQMTASALNAIEGFETFGRALRILWLRRAASAYIALNAPHGRSARGLAIFVKNLRDDGDGLRNPYRARSVREISRDLHTYGIAKHGAIVRPS